MSDAWGDSELLHTQGAQVRAHQNMERSLLTVSGGWAWLETVVENVETTIENHRQRLVIHGKGKCVSNPCRWQGRAVLGKFR
jgi:hypothetical protein